MKVTAFIRYDIYPYYIVLEGDLQENFDVKTSCGAYHHRNVLCVKPISELKQHEDTHKKITREHKRLEAELRVDLLKKNGINFINTENF